MSSVLTPTNYPISSSKDGSCRRQTLSPDCCYYTSFCKNYSKSTKYYVPDLKVLALNIVNLLGIKQSSDIHLTLEHPIKTDGSQLTNSSRVFNITYVGNGSKEEVDNGEKPLTEKSTYVYRVMQKDMKVENNRLETFKNVWPLSYIEPADLAAVGFFYLQSGDKVQCAFCHGIIVDWAPGDDPLTEHSLHFPLCPFLLHRDVGNVPSCGKSPFTGQYSNSHPENSDFFTRASCNGESPASSHPKFSRMENKVARFVTFRNWPSSAVKPDALVNAGFFYTGTSDIVTCFSCGGTLGHWDVGDDPLFEHKKHFPHCAYLKSASSSIVKKSNVAEGNVTKHPRASQPSDITEVMKSKLCTEAQAVFSEKLIREALERQLQKGQMFQSLQDLCNTVLEIQEEAQMKAKNIGVESQVQTTRATSSSSDRHMCKICWDKEMGIVFIPCGHMVACPECAENLTKCPLCRKVIENTVRAYMS